MGLGWVYGIEKDSVIKKIGQSEAGKYKGWNEFAF